jgi:hypothetical protein
MVRLSDKLKISFIFVPWLALLTNSQISETTLTTFIAEFERTTIEDGTPEITKGNIYYQERGKITLEVNFPLNQIMVIDDKLMLIYYPHENKGFRIKSKFLMPPPFVNVIPSFVKPDSGLSELGFKLVRHEKKDGKLYTYWEPPKKKRKELGLFILCIDSDKPVYAEAQLPDGTPAVKTWYYKHVEYKGRFIPVDFYSENKTGGKTITEHVIFTKVEFNLPIPEYILSFNIPETALVKEVQW